MYDFSDRVKNLTGNAIREIFKYLADPEMISFAGGLPATNMLPKEEIGKFMAECLEENPTAFLQYGSTEGYLPLRNSYLDYVKRCGIENQSIDNTLIISGGQQGIDLMCKCFLNKGDAVLVQKPTYLAVLHILKTYEASVFGVEQGEDGLDLNDLEEQIKAHKPKFLYLVPNFLNPTGKTLTVETRKKALEICEKYGVLIVEDDPYRELRFEGTPLPSIKSFDKTGTVVYLSSMSKTIAPALRVGCAVGPEEVIRKMTIGKQAVDVHTNTLAQGVVDKFIRTGAIDKQIERAKPVYKEKKDLFIENLDRLMPSSFVHTNPEGGLFIWGEFTDGTSAKAKFREAIENKVAFVSGNDFFFDGSGDHTIRLNFSNATKEQIEVGLHRLAKIFKK
ncbi:MAG: PLP-dependent aminotransferase family protein [Clostridia bacterium]|nr:PLP-dependent aminotransferase family protein [Clostridia bacterium]